MIYKIEITNKDKFQDILGNSIKKAIQDLGIKTVNNVKVVKNYRLYGKIEEKELKNICETLFVDPIIEQYSYNKPLLNENEISLRVIDIVNNSGVMDPIENSSKKGIQDIGIKGIESIKTSYKYFIYGQISDEQFQLICDKILMNKVIQHPLSIDENLFLEPKDYNFKLQYVKILKANTKKLLKISKEGQLFLNLDEMLQIQNYFRKLHREPTDIELETLAQTWSEHCKHKTFNGLIEYNSKIIDNLLKSTIIKVTEELNKDWCVSVFKDNAGIITFDNNYNICFKVETHNHPSALEPYGGAGTGIGGVIRDSLGVGLGAKPIINTDVFCFGPPDLSYNELPQGTLHPKRIFKGVVAGVRDYGNRMGIPTSNGAILFDKNYVGNPLVYCGNVGIIPKNKCFKKVEFGDLILLVGGRTGRDGIHGATFSSGELTSESEIISSSSVQIGNPIMEKKLVDTILKARDKNLYNAITDCGGGGLSSAVGEMGEKLGVEVFLEKVPLKYHGLSYTEIWISEAQERMVLAVPQANLNEIIKIFNDENVEATVIGQFTNTKKLQLKYNGIIVANLDMEFLHHGIPRFKKKAVSKKTKYEEPILPKNPDLNFYLKKILSSWNVCSKEWVIRQYDHEVQGGSVLKPLQGINYGPGDACVTLPLLNSSKGIILGCGINFKYGLIDTYHMAASNIDEALRQIIAVGGSLEKIALLDNFCWGNTNKPEILGDLVKATQACYDIAKTYETPFISGKDSLNNEYTVKGKTISIPPTLLISAISVLEDVTKAVSMDLKQAGNLIYIIGMTFDELGGSQYYDILGYIGNNVPKVNPVLGKKIMQAMSKATNKKFIKSCHDCSDGGIGIAASEMSFSSGLGMELYLKNVPYESKIIRDDVILFSESNTRFIVEIEKQNKTEFEKIVSDIPFSRIGEVKDDKIFKVYGLNGDLVINTDIFELKKCWQNTLIEL